jgi:hypothetical protein
VQVLVYLHLRSAGFAPWLIIDDVTMKNIRLSTTLYPDQLCTGVYESRQPMWNAQHIREIDTCIPDLCGCIIHSGSLLIEMIFICYDVSQFWLRSFCFSSAYPTNPHDFALTRFSQEDLPGELEKLKRSYEESQESATKGIPFEEALDELGRKYGFVPDRESEDERELHREVMRAELAYGMHSREKELAAILAALQEGPTE